jgi:serine/threonine protein kinase
VKYLDSFVVGSDRFIVMEFCEQGDLKHVIDECDRKGFFFKEEVFLLCKFF